MGRKSWAIKKRRGTDVSAASRMVLRNSKASGSGENQIQISPEKVGKEGAENTKSIKSPSDQKLGGKDNNNHNTISDEGDIRATEIDIIQEVRVLRSDKVSRFGNYYTRRRYKGGIPKDVNSVFNFTSKYEFPQKSGSDEPRKQRKIIEFPQKSGSDEPRKQRKIISPNKEKWRVDITKSKTALRTRTKESRSSTETSLYKKQSSKVGGVVSHIAKKQKLKVQIKGILLSAGWTIDLRPRRGRNYEDSIYIPPEGGSGYPSITKAYAIYQNRFSITNNVVGKKTSSGRRSRNSASQSVVPLESLALLKRRRKAEDSEKFQEGRMKRVKQTSNKSYLRDQVKGKLASNSIFSYNSTSHKNLHKGINKKGGRTLLARGGHNELEADDDADYVPYVWKRTILSWMIDMGVLPINGKVKYMNQQKTKTKLEGWITREGINCSCCSQILSISEFELHAGSQLLHPSRNIFLEDGEISLFMCQLEAWKKQVESERQGSYNIGSTCEDPNDDICGICGDGGFLMCCDACPSTFHLNCLGIEKPPPGDWLCTNCCCKYCASGENDGAVPLLFSCHQCEARYHTDCTPCTESVSATYKNPTVIFCAKSCRMLFGGLQKLLETKHDIDAGLSWSVVRCFNEDSSDSALRTRREVECNSKIAVAFAVMNECFLPIVDQRSGINLIHSVVYNCRCTRFVNLVHGSFLQHLTRSAVVCEKIQFESDELSRFLHIYFGKTGRNHRCGIYPVHTLLNCTNGILTTSLIHGTRLAEMPFIGTRNIYRCQGMCRRLLSGIESALSSLNVEKLVIPAISELKDTWINVFGFRPLEVSQEFDARPINILVFPGTGLLQKQLLKSHSTENVC